MWRCAASPRLKTAGETGADMTQATTQYSLSRHRRSQLSTSGSLQDGRSRTSAGSSKDAWSATLVNPSPLTPVLIRIGDYPHIAAGSSGTYTRLQHTAANSRSPVAAPRPTSADASVGISAVVTTKAVAAKQTITDLGNMAPLLCTSSAEPTIIVLVNPVAQSHNVSGQEPELLDGKPWRDTKRRNTLLRTIVF